MELKYSRKIEIRFWNYAMILKIKFKYGMWTTPTPLQKKKQKNKKNEQRPLTSNNFIQPFIIINCK